MTENAIKTMPFDRAAQLSAHITSPGVVPIDDDCVNNTYREPMNAEGLLFNVYPQEIGKRDGMESTNLRFIKESNHKGTRALFLHSD